MWKPPERIKYDTDPGRWPTADEAAKSVAEAEKLLGASDRSAAADRSERFAQMSAARRKKLEAEAWELFHREQEITETQRRHEERGPVQKSKAA